MCIHVAERYQLADIGAVGMADLFLCPRAAGVLAEILREHSQLSSYTVAAILGPEYMGGWANSHLI